MFKIFTTSYQNPDLKIGVIIILSCYGGNVEHDFTKGTELDKKVAQNN